MKAGPYDFSGITFARAQLVNITLATFLYAPFLGCAILAKLCTAKPGGGAYTNEYSDFERPLSSLEYWGESECYTHQFQFWTTAVCLWREVKE